MSFKAGDKVVCINAKGADNLIKNDTYTVRNYWDDSSGGCVLLHEANPNFGHVAFFPHRFRKLDYDFVEEVIEMINEDNLVSN